MSNTFRWSDELYHHGTLGMKWGIRRYQNLDGSLTEAGRKRYGKDIKIIEEYKNDAGRMIRGINKDYHYLSKDQRNSLIKGELDYLSKNLVSDSKLIRKFAKQNKKELSRLIKNEIEAQIEKDIANAEMGEQWHRFLKKLYKSGIKIGDQELYFKWEDQQDRTKKEDSYRKVFSAQEEVSKYLQGIMQDTTPMVQASKKNKRIYRLFD